MNRLAPHAFPAKNGSDDVMISDRYQEIKFRVFDVTLEYLERQGITGEAIQHSTLLDEIARSISIVLGARGLALNSGERTQLILDVANEVVGFGPLQPLLDDPAIDDVIVNGPTCIYVERRGELEPARARFRAACRMRIRPPRADERRARGRCSHPPAAVPSPRPAPPRSGRHSAIRGRPASPG